MEVITSPNQVPTSTQYQLDLRRCDKSRRVWTKKIGQYKPASIELTISSFAFAILRKLEFVPEIILTLADSSDCFVSDKDVRMISSNSVKIEVSEKWVDPNWFLINTPKLTINVDCYSSQSLYQLLEELQLDGQVNESVRFADFSDDECGVSLDEIKKVFPNLQTLKTWAFVDDENDFTGIPRYIARMHRNEYKNIVDVSDQLESLDLELPWYDYDEKFEFVEPKCPNYRIRVEDENGDVTSYTKGEWSTLLDQL